MSEDSTLFSAPHRLHPAAIVINFGVYFIATVKNLALPLVGIFLSGRNEKGQFMALMTGIVIAVVGGISLIGPILNYFSTTFYIEGDALIISSGFVWRKRRTIPLARIQNVNVERTLWHRILGAASVKVETAAGVNPKANSPLSRWKTPISCKPSCWDFVVSMYWIQVDLPKWKPNQSRFTSYRLDKSSWRGRLEIELSIF